MIVLPDRLCGFGTSMATLAVALCLSSFATAQQPPALAVTPPPTSQPAPQAGPPPASPAPAGTPAASPSPTQTPPEATPPAAKPGFIDALNKWFDKGAADLKESLEKSGQAAKEATEAWTKLPGARVVEGRERCVIAANGSPDCVAAAESVCKAKGFGSGKSLETQATQKCPAKVWLSGRTPAEGECTTETFVIRSVCQ